jgi:hypothetical protein
MSMWLPGEMEVAAGGLEHQGAGGIDEVFLMGMVR